MGRKTDQPFNPEHFPLVVAHRGSSADFPENTLPAFEGAIRAGADVVEVDVRLTGDGVPVILHDPDVSRTTNGTGLVHELTFEQVRGLEAGLGPDGPARVPALYEALDAISGRAGVNLEIKNLPGQPGFVADDEPQLEAVIEQLGITRFAGPVLISSFNPQTVDRCRELAPELATGLLSRPPVEPFTALSHARVHGLDFVLPAAEGLLAAGATIVRKAHEAGVLIGTWTVDDEATLRTLFSWGIDGVATNRPDLAVRVYDELR